jgi:hypothetical protein
VVSRLHAGVDLRDFTFWINDESVPRREFASFVVPYRPIFGRDFRVWIGEQFEIQPFLSYFAKSCWKLCASMVQPLVKSFG